MQRYHWVAIVTLVFGLVLFGMSLVVSRFRVTRNVVAPAVTGDPSFERAFRAHLNTLEWTPIALPAMWLFAALWSDDWAALLGAAWVLGRIIYFVGYVREPDTRFAGMTIQTLAAAALSLGALARLLFLAL